MSKIIRTAGVASAALGAMCTAALAAGPIVRTKSGLVQGTVTQASTQYLGIPYAAPPVGALRWKAPQAPASWQGVRQATSFGSNCAQPFGAFGVQSNSEDCLYLNVYVPPNAVARNLPVIVWIHGGAYFEGEGSDYDGSALASTGNEIVVTINYRLGYFGFLAHPALSAEASDKGSGDYGFQDQQAALQWVRSNISAFGGNPGNVTVAGESAGGESVIDHLVAPGSLALFQRAIIESGSYAIQIPDLSTAENTGKTFAAAAGCSSQTASCLRGLSTSAIVALTGKPFPQYPLTQTVQFGPNLRPAVLPVQPNTQIGLGLYQHVPILQGTNHDEARLFTFAAYDLLGMPLTAQTYPGAVDVLTGPLVQGVVLNQYPLTKYATPDLAFSTLFTDAGFSCPATTLDDDFAKGLPLLTPATYTYEFNDPDAYRFLFPADPSLPLGADHTSELPFLFPGLKVSPLSPGGTFTADEQTLSTQMLKAWTNFARSGNPNGSGVPAWTAYNALSRPFQELVPGATRSSTGFYADHQCNFWAPLLALEALIPPSLSGGLE